MAAGAVDRIADSTGSFPVAAGLTLFCAVPTTLGVGISLVRSCGGNEGLALLLTGVPGVML